MAKFADFILLSFAPPSHSFKDFRISYNSFPELLFLMEELVQITHFTIGSQSPKSFSMAGPSKILQ